MSRMMLGVLAAFGLVLAPAAVTGQDRAPPGQTGETKDRLSDDRMSELVEVPIAAVEERGLTAGKAAFDRLLNAARRAHGAGSVEVADLLTSFGVRLYLLGASSNDRVLREASFFYLETAIQAYRAAFGPAHPEVALALNTYANGQYSFYENDPPPSVDAALEEAYRIRLAAFGPTNPETLASLRYLARIKGHPTRTRGDPARIDAAADLFRRLVANSSNDQRLRDESAPYARTAFARMYARNHMAAEAREQLRLAAMQAAGWGELERCLFAGHETAEVEALIAGRAMDAPETVEAKLAAGDRCYDTIVPAEADTPDT